MTRTMQITMTVLHLAAGCDATTAPSQLDRPRILAVHVSPPGIAADQAAAVDVLVGSGDGTVAVVLPDAIEIEAAPAGAAIDTLISRGDDGWSVTCPPEQELARLRGQLGLEPDSPIALPLAVSVEVDGQPLTAAKSIALGSDASNPELAGIEIAGAEVDDDGAVVIRADDAIDIAADGAAGETELSYAWFSSVGEIDLYLSERAVLTAQGPSVGQLVLIVRDQRGGVTWAWQDIRVE